LFPYYFLNWAIAWPAAEALTDVVCPALENAANKQEVKRLAPQIGAETVKDMQFARREERNRRFYSRR
jgi:hypothetical protein